MDSPAQTEGRYELRTRHEVVAVFSALVKSPIPITLTLAQSGETVSCFLIEMNPAFEELIFEAGNVVQVSWLDGSGGLVATVQINAIWFRFEALNVVAARGYDRPAFRARMPSTLSRTQRRDSARYPVPALNPPVCDVTTVEGSFRLRVLDISLSGIALAIDSRIADYPIGERLEKCLLQLPEMGAIQTDLVVAYRQGDGDAAGHRIGCRFSNMLASSLMHLQRYVGHLQREHLTLDLRPADVAHTAEE
jgi:c-di-GMP-binding flagellar brake protein YcgR